MDYNPNGNVLALAFSYTWDKGEIEHPNDRLMLRVYQSRSLRTLSDQQSNFLHFCGFSKARRRRERILHLPAEVPLIKRLGRAGTVRSLTHIDQTVAHEMTSTDVIAFMQRCSVKSKMGIKRCSTVFRTQKEQFIDQQIEDFRRAIANQRKRKMELDQQKVNSDEERMLCGVHQGLEKHFQVRMQNLL
jgi:hypothetical protein